MWDFYESQLAFLVFFSIFFYGLDKKLSWKANAKERSTEIEHGSVGPSDNVSTLARKYLIVYAVVMGEINLIRIPHFSDHRAQVPTGFRAHTFTHCTTKSTNSQSEWLHYSL